MVAHPCGRRHRTRPQPRAHGGTGLRSGDQKHTTKQRPAGARSTESVSRFPGEVARLAVESLRAYGSRGSSFFAEQGKRPPPFLGGGAPLPWHSCGNRSQPTATLFAYLGRFRGRSICHRLPPVATARFFLKKGGLSSSADRGRGARRGPAERCQCLFSGAPPLMLPDGWMLISFLALGCTPCRWELFRLLNSIRGRQAAKAKRELAGTEVPLVVRGAGLKGWLRESMCQAAIRILRATAALAELWLRERPLTSR